MCPGSLANFPEGVECHIHVLRHCPRSRTPSLQSRFAFHTSQRSDCRVPCSWPEASTCATRGRRTSRIRGTNSPSSSRTSRRSHAPSPYILRNVRVESLDQVLCVSLSGFATNCGATHVSQRHAEDLYAVAPSTHLWREDDSGTSEWFSLVRKTPFHQSLALVKPLSRDTCVA